jgi:hypothetical protein
MPEDDDKAGLPPDATQPMPAVPADEPTQVMPVVPSDDATQVMPAVPRASHEMPPAVAPPVTSPVGPAPRDPRRNGPARFAVGLAIALVAILLVSVVAALIARGGWFSSGPDVSPSVSVTPSATPSASPSPSVTPSPSETPEPSPTPTETTPAGPQFTSFVAPSEALCPDEMTTADVTVTWTSSGAVKAWIGIATDNAKQEPYSEVPPSGSATLPFPCSNASQKYTVTLEDASGNLAHRSATVERTMPSVG